MSSLEQQAQKYHRELPGLVRAALEDGGVSRESIDRFELGWDGKAITLPVRSSTGCVVFSERWDPSQIGAPLDELPLVALFGQQTLEERPRSVVYAEGIHEALVFESQGLPAIAATGTGRFFKAREWTEPLASAPEVLLAFKAGERRDRKRHLKSRREVVESIREAVPHACEITWPAGFTQDQGAFTFFKAGKRTREEFLALPRR